MRGRLIPVLLDFVVLVVCLAAGECPKGSVRIQVICTEGSYKDEVRWEVKQFGNVVVSGQGGDTKDACVNPRNALVTGWDTYGDGWNGARIRIVAADGTILFPEWEGPVSADNKNKVEKSFAFVHTLCAAGYYYNSSTNCTQCSMGRFGVSTNIHTNETLEQRQSSVPGYDEIEQGWRVQSFVRIPGPVPAPVLP